MWPFTKTKIKDPSKSEVVDARKAFDESRKAISESVYQSDFLLAFLKDQHEKGNIS
jgi:hypothetical protein